MAGPEHIYDAFDLHYARRRWARKVALAKGMRTRGAPATSIAEAEALASEAREEVGRIEAYLLGVGRGRPQGVRLEE